MEKYIILGSKHSALLAVDVNKHIKKGYVPIGGVDILSSTGSLPPHFYQAMMLKQGELGVITVDSPVKQCHEEIKKKPVASTKK